MKNFTKIISVSALLFAVASPASAIVSSNVTQSVRAAAGFDSNVNVQVSGDTVTLSGFVENEAYLENIESAAKSKGALLVRNNVHTLGTSGYGSE